ncbi:Crp/Fnr family transcriptional regulator [Oceanirhabdus sp. W0125-5]|uniref:Crp/Fnr family transcriptional regulator n=1 Tax=Oceanirhabdus sp. W0125-5 TaxID=2999116 RepID=UPI0022F2D9A7|nr:Crp/Fnr family transcriptional regulator [Oceanirhabdus sp. W0125-5]WBW96110.1 Crp/Fnr family transcriptional regulator [Oceanirhabdus sp. W0125-5]
MNKRSGIQISIKDIENIRAFRGITEESKNEILNIAKARLFERDETLFFEKDQINKFYGILSGKVSLARYSGWGQKRIFFLLGEGELINEVVFDELPVSVMCEIFDDAVIVEFKKEEFLKVMEKDFSLTLNIMSSIGKKQRRLYRQLKNTVPIKMDKKLAAKLWKLSRDYGISKGEWILIDLKITVTYLSYMLGSSRETISRAMKVLLNEGVIKWDGKKLLVHEESLLKYYRD